MRDLNEREKYVLDRMLREDFQGRNEVAEQIRNAQVEGIDENGSVAFRVTSAVTADVRYAVPVEASADDSDGISIHFLLHVRDGRVHELEIYKDDGSPIRRWPPVDNLELFAPPFKWE